ncbi:MAG: polysaccharide biosynthesis tyrosine autokinase [Verrucomicrobiales bacterium]|nr:polysaccharide biosynthesis tyrosine autokinase [Verrucomicrobiales bacterium]
MTSPNNGYPPDRPAVENTGSGQMDARYVFHVILERAWIVASVFVVALLVTVAYLNRAPRIFAATATLQVEQREQKILKFEKVVQEDLQSMETMRTILQTIKTRILLERVAVTNHLAADPRFTPAEERVDGTALPTASELAHKLDRVVRVALRPGTRLIDVIVEHQNPELTAQIANSLVESFIRYGFEQDNAASTLASENLMREAERMKTKLHDSEVALQNYLSESKSISLEERQNIVTPKLKELSQRLTEAKATRIKQESEFAKARLLGTNIVELQAIPTIAADPTVMGLQLNLAKVEADFSTLKLRYRPEHPKYLQMASQLAEMRDALATAVLRAQQGMATTFESSRTGEIALEQALQEQEKTALELNQKAIQYSVLSREVESDRAMYDAVLSRLKETSLTKELASYKVRVVESALPPTKPIRPQRMKILVLGLILGLLSGIGLALGINSLDNTCKSIEQAEEALGIPVLATIPKIKDLEQAAHQVIVSEDSTSQNAEAFRTLRASLSMLGRVEDRRVFLFTSAMPQEGKTFTSLNFAMSLAQQGLRTLLIDCDLRRPNVERSLYGKRTTHPGVADYLTGRRPLEEIIQTTEFHDFFIIGVGSSTPNPAELLAQGRMSKLLEEALEKYDRIVIDSAPIQAVSDTLLVLEGVQTVCLTVRAGKTPRKASARALQTLRNAGAPVAGIVLNCLRRPRGGGYYYNYYDYSYGQREDDNKNKTKGRKVVDLPKVHRG